MKRSLSLVLALVMILGSFSSVFATDTVETATATAVEIAGEFLAENGVLKGNLEGDLKLGDDLKRRDAVVLLSRLYGVEEEAKATPADDLTFKDITDDNYKGYIAWSVNEGIIEGFSATEFGFNKDIKAQDFATVVLRVLGYEVNEITYPKAIETAAGLGVLKDLEVENRTTVTRGIMAVMTFNALGVKINGTNQTLAEKLGIEMPAPDKVEVVSVEADNLKEIKVELNTLKGLDLRALTNAKNYRTDAGEVKEIFLDGNTVVVVLKDGVSMTQAGNYKLTVRDVKGVEFVDRAFKAYDNTAPKVEEVVVLGSMGIRVRMSEPVKNADERSFLLDGRTFVSTVKTDGRDLTIIPYPNFKEFDKLGKQALTVNAQEDFAGYKSANFSQEIDIQRDETKPVVENIEVTNNSVIVTFKDEVYPASVKASNVGWTQYGYAKVTSADEAKVLSGKRVEYVFKGAKELPRPTVEVEIKDVTNYSNVKMDTHRATVVVESDFARPEIVTWALLDDADTTEAQMRLVFNKDLDEDTMKVVTNYTLFEAKDLHPNEIKLDDDAKKVEVKAAVKDARFERGSKNVVIVTFHSEKLVAGQNYILEAKGIRDNTTLRNLMIPKEIAFTDGIGKILHVISATTNPLETEITLVFNKALDLRTAEDLANYRIRTKTESNKEFTLREIAPHAKVTLHKDGKVVTINLPDNRRTLEDIRISSSVMALDGHRYEHGTANLNGRLPSNWVKLNEVKVELKTLETDAVKVVADNEELELAFNLPIVRLDKNAKDHITVTNTSDDTTVTVKAVHLENGVVVVELATALADNVKYELKITGNFGYSAYGMAVFGETKEFTTKYANAPKITNSEVKVNAGGDVVVEVTFDQPMKYKMTTNTAGKTVWETSMKNLSIVDNSTQGKKVSFENANSYEFNHGTIKNNKLVAIFTGDNAALLRNSNGFNYTIVSETGKPVEGINGKELAVGSKNVDEVIFAGDFGLDIIVVDAPNSDVKVDTNAVINELWVNGIRKQSLTILGTINKLQVATDFSVTGIERVNRVVATKAVTLTVVKADEIEVKVELEKDVPVSIDASGDPTLIETNVTKATYEEGKTTVEFEVKAGDKNVEKLTLKDLVVKVNNVVVEAMENFKELASKYSFELDGKVEKEDITIEVK